MLQISHSFNQHCCATVKFPTKPWASVGVIEYHWRVRKWRWFYCYSLEIGFHAEPQKLCLGSLAVARDHTMALFPVSFRPKHTPTFNRNRLEKPSWGTWWACAPLNLTLGEVSGSVCEALRFLWSNTSIWSMPASFWANILCKVKGIWEWKLSFLIVTIVDTSSLQTNWTWRSISVHRCWNVKLWLSVKIW